MISGYVAVVDSDSPLPAISPVSSLYRKMRVKFLVNRPFIYRHELRFVMEVQYTSYTSYSFQIFQNIRRVDKDYIASSLVRISFIQPKRDIVIFCRPNPGELKTFIDTVEVVQNLTPDYFNRSRSMLEVRCLCERVSDLRFQDTSNSYGIMIVGGQHFYNEVLGNQVTDCQLQTIKEISLTSYPLLTVITGTGINLIEFPEALGSLPCLEDLDLSDNRLGEAVNWNWLNSPFIRENLRVLNLSRNSLSSFPETSIALKNLETLRLSENCLRELPIALGKLTKLRKIYLDGNKLEILPAWMYRKNYILELHIRENQFQLAKSVSNELLKRNDFETIRVPSLFETVAKFIVTKRFPFWKYYIPAKLADFLQSDYYCRCRSLVLGHTTGRIIHCWIMTKALAVSYDDQKVPITIHCCSYKCYKELEHYLVSSVSCS